MQNKNKIVFNIPKQDALTPGKEPEIFLCIRNGMEVTVLQKALHKYPDLTESMKINFLIDASQRPPSSANSTL